MSKPKKKTSKTIRGINENSKYYREFAKLSEKIRMRIRQLREDKNLTQEQMQDFELNLRQFQRIESGETKNITLGNLFKIAKALKIKISDLVDN